jgi:Co/Zn/Cd efflux system component
MGGIALLALAANVTSALLLMRFRNGDANIRSVWLCSRNDAIGNVGVIAAAGLVAWLNSPWPDLILALVMASLFTHSAFSILRQARHESS